MGRYDLVYDYDYDDKFSWALDGLGSFIVSLNKPFTLARASNHAVRKDGLGVSENAVAGWPFLPGTQARAYRIPIVFDTFHYECYDRALRTRWRQQSDEGRTFEPDQMQEQRSPMELLPLVSRSWGSRIMKMHISNQKPGGQLGAHSDYITRVPEYLLTLPQVLKRERIDLMVEAKMKEKAVVRLRKKYPRAFH